MWGSDHWGEMVWGGAAAVPLLGPYGFVAMGICFLVGAWIVHNRHRTHWLAMMTATVLAIGPLVALAVTLPHTFSNGTVADADEVNANFSALATEVDAVDARIRDYVNANCRIYFGWRDSCSGCTSSPEKWGYASQAACANGLGANNTCTAPNLGGVVVQTFGLNTGGDVDDSDKFYVGLACL